MWARLWSTIPQAAFWNGSTTHILPCSTQAPDTFSQASVGDLCTFVGGYYSVCGHSVALRVHRTSDTRHISPYSKISQCLYHEIINHRGAPSYQRSECWTSVVSPEDAQALCEFVFRNWWLIYDAGQNSCDAVLVHLVLLKSQKSLRKFGPTIVTKWLD